MRDEELDLIAALAAGDLDPAAVAEAEALLVRDGVYQEEYEAQQRANEALADVGPARMTELERARVRRAVVAEVAAPSPKPAAPRSLRWLRPLAVAAAAVVVVGFAGLALSDLRSGETAAETSDLSTNTLVTASESAAPRLGSDEAGAAEDPTGDATEEIADAEMSPQLQAADGGARSLDLGSVNSRDIDDQYLTDIYLGAAQYTVDDPGDLSTTLLSCAAAAGELSDEPLLAFGTAQYDGRDAQYFGFASRRLIFLDASDCSLLGEHPEE